MKKKLNFFLSALLVLVFGISLNTCSYASTPTVNEITQFIDVIKTKQSNGELNNSSQTLIKGNSSYIAESLYSVTQDINYSLDNLIYISGRYIAYSSTNTVSIDGYFVIANNTFSNDLNYLGLKYSSSNLYNYEMSDKETNLGIMPIYIISDGSSAVTKATSYNYIGTSSMTNINFNFDVNTLNLTNNMIFTTQKTASIYWYSGNEYFAALNNYNGLSYYDVYPKPEPEEPENPEEPDTPGSGTTGTITNPSGDTTGKVDLSGIENSLNNIENKIPTSGDIKDSQVQGNKEFWGNTDDINPEDFENELENNFNGIMENLSGELTQNEIYKSLEGAEDGFLNFFREEQNEEFYDLAFSWPDVEFMGAILIPAGGINISEMCREIESLGLLQNYIRIIFNFSCAIALIKQIYNLVLSTLGIDNPYLYEDSSMETELFEDMDTGQSYVTYSGRATNGSRYRIRSNHTKVKQHNKIGFK